MKTKTKARHHKDHRADCTLQLSALERHFAALGFTCKERPGFDKSCRHTASRVLDPPRFTYVSPTGRWRILAPSNDFRWTTVQRWTSVQCLWFVDFPLEVPADAIEQFMGAV